MSQLAVALLPVLLVVALVTPSPETTQQHKTEQPTAETEQRPRPTAVSLGIIPAQPSQPTANASQDNASNALNKNWCDWYVAFGPSTWSNWALFFAALIAGYVALRTLAAIGRQADLAEKIPKLLEAPYLSIKVVSHIVGANGLPASAPRVEYWIVNHGRTPAFMVGETCAALKYFDLPDAPPYENIVDMDIGRGIAIAPGEESPQHGRCDFAPLRSGELQPSGGQETGYYFFGYFCYDDLFGTRYTQGFGFRYFPPAPDPRGTFTVTGGSAYNYLKKEERKGQTARSLPD